MTFFFQPTVDELKTLSQTLSELKLKTVAFGTYFNLFRPDDTSFMRSSRATMQLVAAHAELFGCKQFVTWSGSYSPQFAGADPRNHTPEAVAHLHRAIREVLLPIIEPIGGRVALEPYYPHVVGTLEMAKEVFAPFPADRIGLLLDPPNFISPDLYPRRDDELRRSFRELGDRIQMVHLKDMKLNPTGRSVDLPGPGGGEMNYPLLISETPQAESPAQLHHRAHQARACRDVQDQGLGREPDFANSEPVLVDPEASIGDVGKAIRAVSRP